MSALLIVVSMSVRGSVDDMLVSFRSPGPDRYADGSVVLDGETYALVWSPGEFRGLDACGRTRGGDRVVLQAPVASGGGCPPILFQVDRKTADELGGGRWHVILLDTRLDGKPTSRGLVNAWGIAAADTTPAAIDSMPAKARSGGSDEPAAVAATAAAAPDGIRQPAIRSIRVDSAVVELDVQRIPGTLRIDSGSRLDSMSPGQSMSVGDGGGDVVTVSLPKPGNSGFFTAVRAR